MTPVGPLGPIRSPDQLCKKIWSHEKCQFRPHDRFFDLTKKVEFWSHEIRPPDPESKLQRDNDRKKERQRERAGVGGGGVQTDKHRKTRNRKRVTEVNLHGSNEEQKEKQNIENSKRKNEYVWKKTIKKF